MTNYEKYKDFIIYMIGLGDHLALVGNKPKPCSKLSCEDCYFFPNRDGCKKGRIKWLNSEYVEPPKLTKREKAFLTSLHPQFKYITRNNGGYLTMHQLKPVRNDLGDWSSADMGRNTFSLSPDHPLFAIDFGFITWEDNKPWEISELLKLEVQDVPD
jgi:hypothetical protein